MKKPINKFKEWVNMNLVYEITLLKRLDTNPFKKSKKYKKKLTQVKELEDLLL